MRRNNRKARRASVYRDKWRLWLSWIDTDEHHAIWRVPMVWTDVSFRALTHFAVNDRHGAKAGTWVARLRYNDGKQHIRRLGRPTMRAMATGSRASHSLRRKNGREPSSSARRASWRAMARPGLGLIPSKPRS
jgi:hypothetical protein